MTLFPGPSTLARKVIKFSKTRKVGRFLKSSLRVAATLLLLAVTAGAQARSIRTDHFIITFPPGTERTARRVAEVAEEVFPHLAAAFRYYDDYAPIHILVRDDSDYGNGAASDYMNQVYIWASNLDWEIRGEHDWIRNVLTHEITHVITLDKARKKWPFRFGLVQVSRFDSNPDISFNFPLYYLNTPKWWVEGIAQMGPYEFGWDTWDSHRDMVLRMAVLEDDLHSYNELGTLSNRTGGYRAEMVYNQGFALCIYIADQYGRDKLNELQEHVGFLSFEVAIRRVLGISAGQLYRDWVRFLAEQYDRQVAEILAKGFFEGTDLGDLNGGVLDYHPAYSPDGRKLAFISSEDRDYRIPRVIIHDLDTAERHTLDGRVDTRLSWSPDGDKLYFLRNRRGHNDLAAYDLDSRKERRLSARLRARDPHVSPDGRRIAFARLRDGNANLCLIDVDGTDLRQLTDFEDGAQIYGPRWSPDGEWLLFSLFRGQDRDIAMIRADSPPKPKDWGLRDRKPKVRSAAADGDSAAADSGAASGGEGAWSDSLNYPDADSSGFRLVLATRADERDPGWLPDGSGFVFASDRSGVFNLYRHDLGSGEVVQVTNVVGGAFTPTVSADGRVAYAGYHANDFDLREFELGAYEREVAWPAPLERDYQTKVELPKLSEEYTVTQAYGRRLYDFIPLLQVGPTFIGNQFGLNQVSGGAFLAATNVFGGEFIGQGILGKNFRSRTDLNTDFLLLYERRLFPAQGNNLVLNPTLFAALRRREVDYVINTESRWDTVLAATTVYAQTSDSTALLMPESVRHVYEIETRKNRFKDTFDFTSVGFELPLGRRNQLVMQYLRRRYTEDWDLERRRYRLGTFVIQDSTDITGSLPAELVDQDTLLTGPDDPHTWYRGLDFFDSHDLSLAWRHRHLKPTKDYLLNPTGRSATAVFRYRKASVVDSLYEQSSLADVPLDIFNGKRRPVTLNEYVFAYTERIGLPFYNRLSLEVLGAFHNFRVKPGFVPGGGPFEGRFYWPLRYYIGGRNFLSGYPYFFQSGSRLLYGRAGYSFPLLRRIDARFLNFTFAKAYAEVFAETGRVSNADSFSRLDLDPRNAFHDFLRVLEDDYLSDVGAEVRLELFTNYRIPLRAYVQVAHPLSRNRLHREAVREQREDARARGLDLNELEPPPKIDKWRYYFGLGFFPSDLLSAGGRIGQGRLFD